jgi:hypothetical protein
MTAEFGAFNSGWTPHRVTFRRNPFLLTNYAGHLSRPEWVQNATAMVRIME